MNDAANRVRPSDEVERWGVLELPLPGPPPGPGPGPEVVFVHGGRRFTAAGFTDDSGRRVARFMPDEEGVWHYRAAGTEGTFVCTPAGPANHGPVRVRGLRFHHADGLPFHPLGTTVAQVTRPTLRALAAGPFNRVRLRCPAGVPLIRLERQVRGLLALGIEAEVPLHGRDIAGTVARLAAFRNVWWCAPRDPELQATILEFDHGRHPLTVHGSPETDFGAPWITHASVRHEEPRAVAGLVADLRKPVILDDCGAEGDAQTPRLSLPAPELVSRIWEGVCQGGYATHGESYGSRPWRTHGGTPHGEAPARIAFLREILADAPPGLRHNPAYYDASTVEVPGEYCLTYLGPHRYPARHFRMGEGTWRIEVIDVWNMTVGAPVTVRADRFDVELPALPYHAVRIRRAPAA
ncbi:DUF5605 domain-containing protein [Streptomyces sp. MP131-18]|uniref:DUF5605 domain-containing protein n=1 Tax=Streptomyces sp. MP131-18 TaxID=1857892 RepID=UPI0009D3635A|nr:DUF5605 domain-containing protein [Streptomyces sp. MP131-18]ONK09646.1 hypothetical protein STBA_03470 [Streptomyces sp. MP131-18]